MVELAKYLEILKEAGKSKIGVSANYLQIGKTVRIYELEDAGYLQNIGDKYRWLTFRINRYALTERGRNLLDSRDNLLLSSTTGQKLP